MHIFHLKSKILMNGFFFQDTQGNVYFFSENIVTYAQNNPSMYMKILTLDDLNVMI